MPELEGAGSCTGDHRRGDPQGHLSSLCQRNLDMAAGDKETGCEYPGRKQFSLTEPITPVFSLTEKHDPAATTGECVGHVPESYARRTDTMHEEDLVPSDWTPFEDPNGPVGGHDIPASWKHILRVGRRPVGRERRVCTRPGGKDGVWLGLLTGDFVADAGGVIREEHSSTSGGGKNHTESWARDVNGPIEGAHGDLEEKSCP